MIHNESSWILSSSRGPRQFAMASTSNGNIFHRSWRSPTDSPHRLTPGATDPYSKSAELSRQIHFMITCNGSQDPTRQVNTSDARSPGCRGAAGHWQPTSSTTSSRARAQTSLLLICDALPSMTATQEATSRHPRRHACVQTSAAGSPGMMEPNPHYVVDWSERRRY